MNSTEIKIDLDNYSRQQLMRFIWSRWRFIFRFRWPGFGRLQVQSVDVRKTRHGYHIRIWVKNKIPSRELNFLQLALGSDYRRECMNLRRIVAVKRMKSWNILYRYKFNGRGDLTSHEISDTRLANKIAGLIKAFQSRKPFEPPRQLKTICSHPSSSRNTTKPARVVII
ncbi:MAG: hypothetical protein ACLPY5_04325 [Candidatus Bathyarchaeia archaeon]